MTPAEIVAFINRTPACFLATQDGDQPRGRVVRILRADERGILFNTGTVKDLYRQLEANPKVELCFYNPQEATQVRVSGRVTLQRDEATVALVLEKLPFLKQLVAVRGKESLAPLLLEHGCATVWTMETNLAPKTYVEL